MWYNTANNANILGYRLQKLLLPFDHLLLRHILDPRIVVTNWNVSIRSLAIMQLPLTRGLHVAVAGALHAPLLFAVLDGRSIGRGIFARFGGEDAADCAEDVEVQAGLGLSVAWYIHGWHEGMMAR